MSMLDKGWQEQHELEIVQKHVYTFLVVLERAKRTPKTTIDVGMNIILMAMEQVPEERRQEFKDHLRSILCS